MRRTARCAVYWVGWLGVVACQGSTVGLASEPDGSVSGGGPGSVGSGGDGSGQGGSPTGTGGQTTVGTGGSPGTASTCEDAACVPTVLLGSAGIGSMTYQSGAVLDGASIYLARQVLDMPGSALDYWLRVTVVDVLSGGSRVLSGPGELASITWSDVTPLAVDSTYVYWFSRNDPTDMVSWTPGPIYLRRAPKERAQPEDLARFDPGAGTQPLAMAVDDTHVYWTSLQQGIFRYPKGGGGGSTPELVKSATGVFWPLALAGDYLYWADTTTGLVLRKGVSAATLADERTVSNGPTTGTKDVCGLVWSGTELYFAQCESPYEVHRVSAAGESDAVLGSSGEEPYLTSAPHGSLALDADNVYFLGSQYLYRLPRTGGSAVAIAQTASGSYQATKVIGVDDSSVYLLAAETSAILKAPK